MPNTLTEVLNLLYKPRLIFISSSASANTGSRHPQQVAAASFATGSGAEASRALFRFALGSCLSKQLLNHSFKATFNGELTKL